MPELELSKVKWERKRRKEKPDQIYWNEGKGRKSVIVLPGYSTSRHDMTTSPSAPTWEKTQEF